LIALLVVARGALGDGAFPDEMSVIFPPNAAHRIIVATTFGLVISDDDGATWRYVCEPLIRLNAPDNVSLYQQGPDASLFAAYYSGLSRSGDGGCSWTAATGVTSVRDAFADPNDASHVIAIASPGSGDALVDSHDGGRTFAGALVTTTNQYFGVELSRTQPSVIYATEYALPADGGASGAWLLRSDNGGSTFSRHPVPISGPTPALLLAVSPEDANTVFLRIASQSGDSLVATTDGGQTFSALLQLSGPFTGFARDSDGTLYVGAPGGDLWSRSPLARTFTRRDAPLLRCLALRNGRLYGCADSLRDGFNVGTSDDHGATWKPLLKFSDIQGPLSCVSSACAADWQYVQKVIAATPSSTSSRGCHCGSAGESWPLSVFLLLRWRRRHREMPATATETATARASCRRTAPARR
jgi:photosystem II stability/assembly factor-like uncharacterized protein